MHGSNIQVFPQQKRSFRLHKRIKGIGGTPTFPQSPQIHTAVLSNHNPLVPFQPFKQRPTGFSLLEINVGNNLKFILQPRGPLKSLRQLNRPKSRSSFGFLFSMLRPRSKTLKRRGVRKTGPIFLGGILQMFFPKNSPQLRNPPTKFRGISSRQSSGGTFQNHMFSGMATPFG